MGKIEFILDPVSHITADAIGKPGQRVFYLQGRTDTQIVSVIIEKFQLQSLIESIMHFLGDIQSKFPELSEPIIAYRENEMQLQPPIDPVFRAGDLGLEYDSARDLVCIIAKEIIPENSDEEPGFVRYWCTRPQLLALIKYGASVIEQGRPICPQCGEPMDPGGHFCPRKNGHKH